MSKKSLTPSTVSVPSSNLNNIKRESRVKPDFSAIIANNPAGFIPRERIGDATGGLIHPRTAANWDCNGSGIQGRFRVGRKICYSVSAVISFLESRIEIIE